MNRAEDEAKAMKNQWRGWWGSGKRKRGEDSWSSKG